MKRAAAIFGAFLLLAGCGQQSESEKLADQLENAAEQSDPAAAEALENAAAAIEAGEASPNAQQALNQAGQAQAGTVKRPQPVLPPLGAKPHAKGDPVPPPKIDPAENHSQHPEGHE